MRIKACWLFATLGAKRLRNIFLKSWWGFTNQNSHDILVARGRVTVTRKAHNLEIAGSNPASATRYRNIPFGNARDNFLVKISLALGPVGLRESFPNGMFLI